MADERGDVVLGDSGFIEVVVTEDDEETLRDLTGCAVIVTFWRPDAAQPHVKRAARVTDPTNGVALYRLRGDEYAASDSYVKIQTTVHQTEYNSSTTGRGGFRSSGRDVSRRILPTP